MTDLVLALNQLTWPGAFGLVALVAGACFLAYLAVATL